MANELHKEEISANDEEAAARSDMEQSIDEVSVISYEAPANNDGQLRCNDLVDEETIADNNWSTIPLENYENCVQSVAMQNDDNFPLANYENSIQLDAMRNDDNTNEKLLNVSEIADVELKKNNKKAKKRKATENDNDVSDAVNPKKKVRKNPTNTGKGKSTGKKGGQAKGVKKNEAAEKPNNAGGRPKEGCEVKHIVDYKIDCGIPYYLVRWKGYTKNHDTWEAEDTLNCPDIIERFKKKKQKLEISKKGANSVKKRQTNSNNHLNDTDNDNALNNEWEVEKIIDCVKKRNGRVLFRIRWKGFGPQADTWEPEENLNCDKLKQEFMEQRNSANMTVKKSRGRPKKIKLLPITMANLMERGPKRSSTKKRST